MPRKKVSKQKTISDQITPTTATSSSFDNFKNFKFNKKIFLIVLILGLVLLAIYKKHWFVAATVNNKPITNFEILSKMNQQYREQTINQIVNERIILDEAGSKNINVTNEDINGRVSQLESSVGGAEVLENLLSQQGQTREQLREQLKLQLLIEKLYINEATVSAQEIDQFIEQNKDSLRSSDSASQKQEAEETLKQQKISTVFNEKFQQLREKANIKIF